MPMTALLYTVHTHIHPSYYYYYCVTEINMETINIYANWKGSVTNLPILKLNTEGDAFRKLLVLVVAVLEMREVEGFSWVR